MHPQRANRQPDFYHTFNPLWNEILNLHQKYQVEVLDWQVIYQQELKRLNNRKELLNSQASSGTQWNTLDREFQNLNIDLSGRRIAEVEITEKIAFNAARIAGMYQEILDDHTGDYLSRPLFIEYLQKYKSVIDTGCILGCYSKPGFEIIKETIKNYLPAKN